MVNHARCPKELLLLKEAIYIRMTPAEERFNRDTGLELPGCWMATLRNQEFRTKQGQHATSGGTRWWTVQISNDTEWHVHGYKNSSLALTSIFVPEDQSILVETSDTSCITYYVMSHYDSVSIIHELPGPVSLSLLCLMCLVVHLCDHFDTVMLS